MKTRTLCGLVFGLALLGSFPLARADVGEPESKPLPSAPATPQPVELGAVALRSQPKPATEMKLSGWLSEVVKLAESGLEEGVLYTYIDSAGTFNISADEIIYLHDIGVPSGLITAMIQHDADIAAGLRQPPLSAPPSSAPPPLAVPPITSKPAVDVAHNAASSARDPELQQSPEVFIFDLLYEDQIIDSAQEVSPVRKPYSVQLTSPIYIYRAYSPLPNLSLLKTLP